MHAREAVLISPKADVVLLPLGVNTSGDTLLELVWVWVRTDFVVSG